MKRWEKEIFLLDDEQLNNLAKALAIISHKEHLSQYFGYPLILVNDYVIAERRERENIMHAKVFRGESNVSITL